jgi:hypothetical protein
MTWPFVAAKMSVGVLTSRLFWQMTSCAVSFLHKAWPLKAAEQWGALAE